MILSDTVRILGRNHYLLWKLILYILVCVLVVSGLALAICTPLVSELGRLGFWDELWGVINTLTFNFNADSIFTGVYQFLLDAGNLIVNNISTVLPLMIVFCVILVVGLKFTIGLVELPLADCVYNTMASNSKFNLGASFIKNLKSSVKLQLSKLCVVLPVEIIFAVLNTSVLFLYAFDISWLNVLVPLIWVFVAIVLVSIKSTIFALWTPSKTIFECGIWQSLKKSFTSLKGNVCAMFGRSLLLVSLCFVLNILMVMFTWNIGLFITLPLSLFVFIVYGLVMTFYLNGLRFYLNEKEIITPKKKENWERVSSLKDFI
ncbi:MAG: hypothetical protein IKQ31_02910 [Clostridia bacterium]|nr:hypothetical protein [Clostridia bacterium]